MNVRQHVSPLKAPVTCEAVLKSTKSRLLIGSSTRMQSKTKQKKNRKLNIYFQNDVMTQKFAHENSEKELDKGRQQSRR